MKLIGIILMAFAGGGLLLTSCSSQEEDTAFKANTINVEELGAVGNHSAYSLKKDGVEYIVVNRFEGGCAIIRHEPIERSAVDMDSIVQNSAWIPEFNMLGYHQALPSKASLETLENPERRTL